MFVEILYDKKCPVRYENRYKFEKFIENLTNMYICSVIERKKYYINNLLEDFDLTYKDLIVNSKKLIKCNHISNGFHLCISGPLEIKGVNIQDLLHAMEFGSNVTGLPKPIFYPILKSIKNNIKIHYIQYLGLM